MARVLTPPLYYGDEERVSPRACPDSGVNSHAANAGADASRAGRARAERAIATARAALAKQAREGPDPRASVQANALRSEANASHHRRNRQWAKEHPEQRDRDWFLREVTPKLDSFSLTQIAQATGLSLAACSRFRAGPYDRRDASFVTA